MVTRWMIRARRCPALQADDHHTAEAQVAEALTHMTLPAMLDPLRDGQRIRMRGIPKAQ